MIPIAPDTFLQQRYRILNLIEDGDLVRTYLAIDRSRSDTEYAIEEIFPSSQFPTIVAKAKELFQQEIALLCQLQHSQISRFWTIFEEQNRLFVVRDYVAGKTYGQLLSERRNLGTTFTESEVWQFLLQILPAISYMHTKGTIHREISPEHIICRDRDLLPVLTNFGVIKEFALKLTANPNSYQLPVGQLGYAPSEQIQSGQISPSTDLYALAVSAIVLLTGKEPSALFEGDQMNWNWRKWTPIGDDFANILERMLNPKPQDRYQTALEVNRDLQSLDVLNRQPSVPNLLVANPSTMPTVAVGGKNLPSGSNRLQTAITNLNPKSIWERPQVFIPVAAMIAIIAGVGSYFGISQLLNRDSADTATNTPTKQIDFNNPTIPTDNTNSSATTTDDLIQPEIGRAIVKEGTVDTKTPVRYRISAIAGQNLDIQLVSASSQTTDPAKSISSPIDPLNPSPSPSSSASTEAQSTNPPISLPNTPAATQVLMTILSPSGAAIDSQAERVVSWRGQIPTSGDYTIELRPITGLTGTTFPYKLSVTQSTDTPSPLPSTTTTPVPGSTQPSVMPTALDGYGNPTTPMATPDPSASPSNSNIIPRTSPAPIQSVAPTDTSTQSAQPTRKRRRRRTQTSPSPQVSEREAVQPVETTPTRIRRRTRVESSTETTPTRIRRRTRVESSTETTPTRIRRRTRVESSTETTPTRIRRRTRQTESTTPKPSPSTNQNSDSQESNRNPTPEPSVGIPVPPAKNATPQTDRSDGDKTTPANETIDTE